MTDVSRNFLPSCLRESRVVQRWVSLLVQIWVVTLHKFILETNAPALARLCECVNTSATVHTRCVCRGI